MKQDHQLPQLADRGYEIEQEIGAGGSGVVYRAWHQRLQKHVVIKELKYDLSGNQNLQRIEIDALKNVKSEYLPQVYDFVSDGGRMFSVMELVDGQSFDKLLATGKTFAQADVLRWYGQLASALVQIHKHGIYHRDVKPANIMLLNNGNVCLIDFNTAFINGIDVKLVSRSLGYASPEQYQIFEQFYRVQTGLTAAASHQTAGGGSMLTAGGSSVQASTTETQSLTNTAAFQENAARNIDFAGSTATLAQAAATGNQAVATANETATVTAALMPTITADLPPESTVVRCERAEINWASSDIYSLGATMYHLATGQKPAEKAAEVRPVSEFANLSEGLIYLIEQSMRVDPAERFADIQVVSEVIANIHHYDRRWRRWQWQRKLAMITFTCLFLLSAVMAGLGKTQMIREKEIRYYEQIQAIENGGSEGFEQALWLFPERIDAYYAKAKYLWQTGDKMACQTWLEDKQAELAIFQTKAEAFEQLAEIYYILGNCYYAGDQPDYTKAGSAFALALEFKEDARYYRDYAISLAKLGKIKEAQAFLQKAQNLGERAEAIALLQAEIALAQGRGGEAIVYFSEALIKAKEPGLKYRAYRGLLEEYQRMGQNEKVVELAQKALIDLPDNYWDEWQEVMAAAYGKLGEYSQAIGILEKIKEQGSLSFAIWQNLAILYQMDDQLDRAGELLKQMAVQFPREYRVPMRQAYLQAEIQSQIKNQIRDYKLMAEYYEQALKLYPAAGVDSEMERLGKWMEQLKSQGWLE